MSKYQIPLLLLMSAAAAVGVSCTSTGHGERPDDVVESRGPEYQDESCGIAPDSNLTGSGIGELRIGRTQDTIRHLCSVVSDTVEFDAEAMPQQALVLAAMGERLRALTNDEGRIWRIEVDTRQFRTAGSLGVGSTLEEFLSQEGVHALEGDGHLFLQTSRHCGISFRLTYLPEPDEHRSRWEWADLRRLPSDVEVDRLLIFGCNNNATAEQ